MTPTTASAAIATTGKPPTTTATPGWDGTGLHPNAAALLDRLEIAPEHAGGYDRDLFSDWIDADRDGCDTRREVLIAESLAVPAVTGRCVVTGEWWSAFDNVSTTDPGSFDVDHLVPLAEAWESGAFAWQPARRKEFANDIDSPFSLIAVSASSNRQKGKKDPAEWMPPYAPAVCGYAFDWLLVKVTWGLTADSAEETALRSSLDGCPGAGLSDQSAPDERPAPVTTTTTTAKPSTTTTATSTDASAGTTSIPDSPGDTRNCSDFATQADAQAWFDLHFPHYGDVAKLDRDGDKVPCQSLP